MPRFVTILRVEHSLNLTRHQNHHKEHSWHAFGRKFKLRKKEQIEPLSTVSSLQS